MTPKQSSTSEHRANTMRNKIKKYLRSVGMSQRAFAIEIDCSQVTFARFMSGRMQSGSFAFSKSERFFDTHPFHLR